MCNLYNLTTTRDAVMQFTKAFRDKAGWNEPSVDIYPNTLAPIVRVGDDGQREIVRATWGMPTPPVYLKNKNYDPGVTNIRDVDSSWWRRWLGPTSRCVVPFTSFAEPDPKSQAQGARVPNAWFAQNPERPLMFFAGFWTPWKGVKKVRDGEREFELYGFLTTSPNEIVKPIHFKAMPAILTTPEEVDLWLTGEWDEVKHLQRPLPGNMLVVVEPPAKLDRDGAVQVACDPADQTMETTDHDAIAVNDTPEPRSGRKIIHVDMDAFYASVEQRDNPELRGKPVAVGGSAARGVVAAASYEARAFGVRSALPSITAKRRCPDLIFVPPRFDVYRAVSAQIREIFAEHTDLIEPLSLDEAYLDVSENKQAIPIATEIAMQIRARIKEVTGLNASAGVSYCKFLAKMASDLNKPNGQAVITPRMGPAFVEALAVKKFHGVGPATAAKMERLGILTGADLKAQSLPFLRQHFGKAGTWYYAIARGIDERPVQPDRPRKSIGAEDTFTDDIFDLAAARAEVPPLAAKVWRHCEAKNLRGRTVTLKVKFSDFQQITRSRTVSTAAASASDIENIAQSLLEPLFPSEKGIRLIGVTVSSFDEEQTVSDEQLRLLIQLFPASVD